MTEVSISLLTAEDGPEFTAAVRASRSLHHPWIAPADDQDRFVAYLRHCERDDQAAYVIRHGVCGGMVGYVTVANIVRRAFLSASVGYGAFADHAGRGLMTLGMRAVLETVFDDLGLHRVEANIQPGNEASRALARRLGFEQEGFSRRFLMIDGDWRDHERWALLSEQFPRPGKPA